MLPIANCPSSPQTPHFPIDVTALTEQSRHQPTLQLEPLRHALNSADYPTALQLLESANAYAPVPDVHINLLMAAIHSLQANYPETERYLSQSLKHQHSCAHSLLYQALHWQSRLRQGQHVNVEDVVATLHAPHVQTVCSLEPLGELTSLFAAHHAACTLTKLGAHTQALALVQATEPSESSEGWLVWQHYRLLGYIQQARGCHELALDAYQQALDRAPEREKAVLQLALAGVWLHCNRADYALAVLDSNTLEQRMPYLAASVQAHAYYLRAHVQMRLGNLQLARAALWQAQEKMPSPDIYSLLAQVHYHLGEMAEAVQAYQWAFRPQLCCVAHRPRQFLDAVLQQLPRRSQAQRYYGYALALSKLGALEQAQRVLHFLLDNDSAQPLPLQGRIYALLAEIHFHQGAYYASGAYAHKAIEHDAIYHGHRLLAHLALSHYDVDAAVTHCEYAASAAERGSAAWLEVNCLLIDALARAGYQEAKRIKLRAAEVLEFMALQQQEDAWQALIYQHYCQAEATLQQQVSHLN